MSEQQNTGAQPTQLGGNIKMAQGTIYTAIGSALNATTGPGTTAESWTKAGKELHKAGQTEISNAQQRQAVDASVDAATAKVKSAWGYVTGDQSTQTRGNIENEQAQWEYKTATEGLGAVPVPSVEGVKGKVQSVVGMVKGDQEEQREGNVRAEKAAWTDGV